MKKLELHAPLLRLFATLTSPLRAALAASVALMIFPGAGTPAAAAEVSEVRVIKQIGLGFLPLMVMEHEKLIEKHARAAGLGEVKGVYTTTVGPAVMYLELQQPGIHRVLSSDDVLGGPTTFTNIFSSSKFRNANPRTYKAALAAFTEAIALINKDKKWAAQVYLDVSNDKKSTVADIQKQLEDPNVVFTTTARNVQKYADFMYEAGYIKTRVNSWKDLYFPDIHDQPGS